MKGIFGLLGLLLCLAIVGVLVKKQLTSTQQMLPALQVPMATDPQGSASTPAATVREQPQQLQQQYKQALEGALQQPRTIPDEK
ncbi:MAG: hypothetical protein PHS32_12105 [Rhodoferax sp.]|uniref:hypothetical protein n=1 Tax=Rhodoferax sp. TaxID=50421 RepID=UPI00261FBA1C|nr:hypothetical protein [Rhodoferax sp.]MDD5334475.1 hypothetical protein [Rhodoferax sp.]